MENMEGPPEEWLSISSYGDGVATIAPGQESGIVCLNSSQIRISRLNILGAGISENRGNGVLIESTMPQKPSHGSLHIEDIDVSGFGRDGISIGSSGQKNGFHGVQINRVHSHDNGQTGIHVWGTFLQESETYSHSKVFIRNCKVCHISGVPGMWNHSGSAIVVSDTDEGVIENCVAHDNGWLNTSVRAGPIGIWAWDCRRIQIQKNESFRNRTASVTDGGGFGLDGGASECILQDNFSHDNDGAGYCLSQFPQARPFFNNLVRNNTSENDALRNHYGAIHLWSDQPYGLRNIEISGNTVRIAKAKWGTAKGIRFQSATRNVRVTDNRFSSRETLFVCEVEPGQTELTFHNNRFLSDKGEYAVSWKGKRYTDLVTWLSDFETEEAYS